tara:strand:+ start:7937 stop:9067 length:1131 start_codon:yes stop_codon:yes gene_type:complete
MTYLKVMTVVGTRPEIIKLSRIIPKLDDSFNHILVNTDQNFDYELNEIFFKDLNLRKPDINLKIKESSASKTIAKVIEKTDNLIKKYKPDAFFLLGDTNSCLSCISAKRNKVPIFHLEAGNRCFDLRVPEEINRKIIDHVSDINLTYSKIARDYLIKEGLPEDQIIKVGSPMKEVLNFYDSKIKKSKVLQKLKLVKNKYILVSLHREENVDDEKKLKKFISILNFLAGKENKRLIISTHPRTKKNLEKLNFKTSSKISFLKPFSFTDYIKLQIDSHLVLSDSGTITEESSILNFPAINLRETHERPEGNEEASVIFTSLDEKNINNALEILKKQKRANKRNINLIQDYDTDNVSEKVTRLILSYTHFVNKKTWKKN